MAWEIPENWIEGDGSLYGDEVHLNWPHYNNGFKIAIDGTFTIEQLEAIIAYAKRGKEVLSEKAASQVKWE